MDGVVNDAVVYVVVIDDNGEVTDMGGIYGSVPSFA